MKPTTTTEGADRPQVGLSVLTREAVSGGLAPAPAPSLDVVGTTHREEDRCRRIVLQNRQTRRYLGVFCGAYSCDKCGPIKRRQLIRRVSMGLESGYPQSRGLRPRFLTLTCDDRDPAMAWAHLTARFQRLRQRVERRYGVKVEYAAFVELTKRGMPHLHIVFRGPYVHYRVWSQFAARSGFGSVVDIRAVRSGEIGGYVTKTLGGYVTKSLGDRYPVGVRRVRFSHQWSPEWVPTARRATPRGETSEWTRIGPQDEAWSGYIAYRQMLAVAGQGHQASAWWRPQDADP